MRIFTMPFDVTGEEKLIGGIISIRQIGYVFTGVTIGAILASLPFWPGLIKVIVFIQAVGASAVLAFIKIDEGRISTNRGISLDKYLILQGLFYYKQRNFRLGG